MPREAVLMVANRKVRVASLTGNVIIFEKDVPVRVPLFLSASHQQWCPNVCK
jgi:hypothetical protein